MKFATLDNDSTFGRLHVVSRDLSRCAPARAASSLQAALESWDEVERALQAEYDAINKDNNAGQMFSAADTLAPMPRAWQWLDGSAFESHGALMSKVLGVDDAAVPGRPLMYQGMSDRFLAPWADAAFPTEDDGIDFEGEFGVITDGVPMNASRDEAARHIRLVVQINDWSLRGLAGIEMKTGFGWVQAKPACGMAPVAVTPDELGAYWRDCRVDMALNVQWNGTQFGAANGYHMAYGFDELVAYAAYSRDLVPGTVVGSGTVSNSNYREVGSSCIAERRGIEMLDNGEATTGFMRFGDRVRMEVHHPDDGGSVFGPLQQQVVAG